MALSARTPALQFTVRGLPAPQGSKSFKGFTKEGRAILAESSQKVKPWRQDVVITALDAMERVTERWMPIAGPVHLVIEFFLPRPKSQPKNRRTVPVSAPDLDKLTRAVADGLTSAGVYRDDALVTDLTVRKRYVVQDETLGHAWELPAQGAVITVLALDPAETWADRPLEHDVADRLPEQTVPSEMSDYAMHAAPALNPTGADVWIPADSSDVEVLKSARRVLTILERRKAMAPEKLAVQPAVTLWVGDGSVRLASWRGQPLTPLQQAVLDIATAGEALQVAVQFVSPEGISGPPAHCMHAP